MRKLGRPFALASALKLTSAHAYVEPGVDAGTLALVLGVLGAIVVAFAVILWHPIKRLFQRRKAGRRPGPGKKH